MKAHIRLWPRSTYSLANNRTLIQYLPGYASERRGFCGRFWKRQHGPVLKIELYLRLLLPMEEIVVGACRSRAYHRQKAKELQDPFHSSTASPLHLHPLHEYHACRSSCHRTPTLRDYPSCRLPGYPCSAPQSPAPGICIPDRSEPSTGSTLPHPCLGSVLPPTCPTPEPYRPYLSGCQRGN